MEYSKVEQVLKLKFKCIFNTTKNQNQNYLKPISSVQSPVQISLLKKYLLLITLAIIQWELQ